MRRRRFHRAGSITLKGTDVLWGPVSRAPILPNKLARVRDSVLCWPRLPLVEFPMHEFSVRLLLEGYTRRIGGESHLHAAER